jgi:hypothetical protein
LLPDNSALADLLAQPLAPLVARLGGIYVAAYERAPLGWQTFRWHLAMSQRTRWLLC